MTKSEISVVIPCYNEQDNIGACLQALINQSSKPYEIIVIDNNCTDQTIQVARGFKGVRIVTERQQGVIAARNAGFMIAKGQIIARLDADSRPACNWLETIEEIFVDSQIQAATGSGFFYDALPMKRFSQAYRNFFAVWLNRFVMGHHMLWGSNMAIRASAWQAVKHQTCHKPNIMEDLDIAAHINDRYGKHAIHYRLDMHVDISVRRAMVSLKRNYLYLAMWPQTLKLHNYQKRALLWPAIFILIASMSFGSKVVRFYNVEEDRFIFSLAQWRSWAMYDRPNP